MRPELLQRILARAEVPKELQDHFVDERPRSLRQCIEDSLTQSAADQPHIPDPEARAEYAGLDLDPDAEPQSEPEVIIVANYFDQAQISVVADLISSLMEVLFKENPAEFIAMIREVDTQVSMEPPSLLASFGSEFSPDPSQMRGHSEARAQEAREVRERFKDPRQAQITLLVQLIKNPLSLLEDPEPMTEAQPSWDTVMRSNRKAAVMQQAGTWIKRALCVDAFALASHNPLKRKAAHRDPARPVTPIALTAEQAARHAKTAMLFLGRQAQHEAAAGAGASAASTAALFG